MAECEPSAADPVCGSVEFYNGARYFEPSLGRYLESDPIGLDGGDNWYVYAENNPVSWTDASGLSAEEENELGRKEIPRSSIKVRQAAKSLDRGATEVTVESRAQAEELFLRRYQRDCYRNVTSQSRVESKKRFGGKAGSYHWDTGEGAYPHGADHLQIHTQIDVIRIYFK